LLLEWVIRMVKTTKCPYCIIGNAELKKEWDYSVFHVKMYVCDNCGKSFKAYYRDDSLVFTIPKA